MKPSAWSNDPVLPYWEEWKKTGSEQSLRGALDALKPIIGRAVSVYSASNIPPAAMRIQARSLAVDALRKYDPSSGASIRTFVHPHMSGLKRFADTYQRVGRIPEHRIQAAATLKQAMDSLSQKYDRPPSVQELSEHLAWPEASVIRIMPFVRKDLPVSGFEFPTAVFEKPWEDKITERVNLYYRGLSSKQQTALEAVMGMHGKKTESQIARMSKIPLKEVQKIKRETAEIMGGVPWRIP